MAEDTWTRRREEQKERVRSKTQRVQERLERLPALLDTENSGKTQADLFMVRAKVNELYSELTVYIYLLREEEKQDVS